jgi:hypothetical protein
LADAAGHSSAQQAQLCFAAYRKFWGVTLVALSFGRVDANDVRTAELLANYNALASASA